MAVTVKYHTRKDTVDDMKPSLEVFTIHNGATILQAIAQMQRNKARAVIVLEKQKVVGVVSEGDVIRALIHDHNIYTPINGIMKLTFSYLNEKNNSDAFKLFKKYLFGLLPVVDEDMYLIDVVTIQDIFSYMDKHIIRKSG